MANPHFGITIGSIFSVTCLSPRCVTVSRPRSLEKLGGRDRRGLCQKKPTACPLHRRRTQRPQTWAHTVTPGRWRSESM